MKLDKHFATFLTLFAIVCPWGAQAQEAVSTSEPRWELNLSPYTHHLHRDEDHDWVWFVGFQRNLEDGKLTGFSVFSNSFGQPSAYAFVGQRYEKPFGWDRLYWQWTAGVIYGYVDPYKNKVPLNVHGFSPAVIPSVGYRLTDRTSLSVTMLGTNALMFNASWALN